MTAEGAPARKPYVHTLAARMAISNALRGRPLPDWHKENISAGVRKAWETRRRARLAESGGESG